VPVIPGGDEVRPHAERLADRVPVLGWSHHQSREERPHPDGDTGSVPTGRVELFRLLRNVRGASVPDYLVPVAAASGAVTAVESAALLPAGSTGTGVWLRLAGNAAGGGRSL
jgi:hypothetical protein